jgi:hypothetical protein
MIDHAKIRRESMRWYVLLTLYNASPVGAYEELVLATMQGIYPDATQLEIRQQLDYLATRDLVQLTKEPGGRWFSDLSRNGTDVVEYTVSIEPGIARPERY